MKDNNLRILFLALIAASTAASANAAMTPLTIIWGVSLTLLFIPVWLIESFIVYLAANRILSCKISLKRSLLMSFAANAASTIGGFLVMQIGFMISIVAIQLAGYYQQSMYLWSLFTDFFIVYALGFVLSVIIEAFVVKISAKNIWQNFQKPLILALLMNLASYALLAAIAVIIYLR